MSSPWPALLDAFEEQLRRQADALRRQAEPPGNLPLPFVEQPIPADLAPRAVSLHLWCLELEREAAELVNRQRPQGRAYGRAGRTVAEL